MALMNDDELGLVSGGGRTVSRMPWELEGGTMPADNCPMYKAYAVASTTASVQDYTNRDCVNCQFYDFGKSNKCTKPGGIRFGK